MTASGLISRVVAERRTMVAALALAAVANVGVYALVVYPLSLRVGSSERRADAARIQLQKAESEERTARAMITRTEQADKDLIRFYSDILPRDVAGARRLTYARLASLAAEHGLIIDRRSFSLDVPAKGRLHKLKISMALAGDYADMRQFMHAVESAPEFLVIEHIALAEGNAPDEPLSLQLELATYFAGAADGA